MNASGVLDMTALVFGQLTEPPGARMRVAENFTGLKGKYVPLKDTVRSFAAIVDGEADDLPEWAFFNVGTLEDARQKAAEKMAEEKGGAV